MPVLYVIAGPNGIGKTTSAFDIVPNGIPIINSDEISKEVKSAGIVIQGNAQEYSNYKAMDLVNDQLKKKNTFAIETNLADTETWKFLIQVQGNDYEVHVIYMSTDNLDVLNNRISQRVKLGEHYVLPEVVRERYLNGLGLLNHYFKEPDKLQLFDNSISPQLLIEAMKGNIVKREEVLPQWISQNLAIHITGASTAADNTISSIEEARKKYKKMRI